MRVSLTKASTARQAVAVRAQASTARQAVAVRAQASKGEATAPATNTYSRRELALRSVNLLALAAMFTWGAAPTPSTIGACDRPSPRLLVSPSKRARVHR